MKKLYLYITLGLAISMSLLATINGNASATSDYDNAIGVIDRLYFSNTGAGYTLPEDCSAFPEYTWNNTYTTFIEELADDGEVDFGDNLKTTYNYTFNGTTGASMYNSWSNKESWAVSQYRRGNDYGYSNQINITWTTTPDTQLSFANIGGAKRLLPANITEVYNLSIIMDNSSSCSISVQGSYSSSTGAPSIFQPVIAWSEEGITTWEIYYAFWGINYPEGYDGIIPPEVPPNPEEDEKLMPEYSWSVTSEGKLKVTYLKNISPFLMGANYIVINEMTTNWEDLGDEVLNDFQMPAGTFDYEYQLATQGYYMIRIDYSQDFNLPWQPPYPYIEQVWIQIHYNGKAISGTNVGGCDGICNPQKDTANPVRRMFDLLNIPVYGLQQAILAPLDYMSTLPSAACTPISLPLPNGIGNITLPCMTTAVYQPFFNTILVIYQTILTGLFSYYICLKMFGTIKDISNPRDDSIETVKL